MLFRSKGFDTENYKPDQIITREQLITILHRYANYKEYDVSVTGGTTISDYADGSKVSQYAIPAMQWGVAIGLIEGTPEGTLDPLGDASRAQVASILQRFIKMH